MGLYEFIASQLRKPSGFCGRHLASRFMNWSNADLNRQTLVSLSLEPDDRVLELGFGAGDLISRVAAVLAKGSIAGIDFSPEMVEVCTKRFASLIAAGRIELRCASAEALPYGADEFTKACTVNTVYFWLDPAVPMRELWRVLRVGGRLVVGFVPRTTLGKFPFTRYGFTHYDPDQISRLFADAGFRSIEMISGTDRRGEFICAIGTK
jgi:ubiquinone/menaquinone biosynthesis C-methylase UbiE